MVKKNNFWMNHCTDNKTNKKYKYNSLKCINVFSIRQCHSKINSQSIISHTNHQYNT